jgi:serine/threonine protein kinase
MKACVGLREINKYGLHHRDIAARNILLGAGAYFDNTITIESVVKVTDFGMTRKAEEENENQAQTTKSDSGPLKWLSPESIQHRIYDEKSDVYMWAITMWEIMYGKEPYENEDAIDVAMKVCMQQHRPEFAYDLPPGLKSLIEQCWHTNPKQRPPFKDISQNLWSINRELEDQNIGK